MSDLAFAFPACRLPAFVMIAAAIAGLAPGPAAAQANRTFVSGSGSDTNPCNLGSPCRSFAQAITQTNAGGEIVALDAAGYGALTIGKSVSITAIGVPASITTSSGSQNGITINAGVSDVVKLRGLSLYSGSSSGIASGISVSSASSVTIEDCTISGFPGDGILVSPSASLDLTLLGGSVDDNANDGLHVNPLGSGAVTIGVDGTHFGGNVANGFQIVGQFSTGTINATVSLSAESNGSIGIFINSITGKAHPVVMVTGSKLANNGSQGLNGSGPVTVFVDHSQIFGNGGDGWETFNSAVVKSFTDNAVGGNANDGLNGVTQIVSD